MAPTAPEHATPERRQRLAIVHLLGWTLGVALVLTIYRIGAAWRSDGQDAPVSLSWPQLGYGLGYGTALSGFGLFLWRRWTRAGSGPTQPGHWLLVFCGIGLLIDVTTAAALEIVLKLGGSGIEPSYFGAWLAQQFAAWGLAWLGSLVVLSRLRASWWMAAAWVLMLFFLAKTLVCLVSFVGFWRSAPGMWWYYLPAYTHFVGLIGCILVVVLAELVDRVRGVPRDWLHGGGILAALTLGLVDLAMVGWLILNS